MLTLLSERLDLDADRVQHAPIGALEPWLHSWLRGSAAGGVVVLGSFGAGKTALCARLADHSLDGAPPCTYVPLAFLGRAGSIAAGLERAVGRSRLEEARDGRRVLLLDGLDEVPEPAQGYDAFFRELTAQAGPRWLLTGRPSHFRTSETADPDQVDSLTCPGVTTLVIDPLPRETVREVIHELPNGRALLASVDGLEDLATSPLLLHIIHAALPYIEPGRPIEAWGLFDAWLRYALNTGPSHHEVLAELETLAWGAFRESGWSTEMMSFSPDVLANARLPAMLRRTLFVTELDGRARFGHRSVFEYLLAAHLAPRLAANQGQGPDETSGLRITDATRAFLVGRVPRMPVRFEVDRVCIPRGNFVAGGANAPDERPLRIQHLAEPFWIARLPVTHADWARYLDARPDDRQDAWYLAHWGADRRMPPGTDDLPIYNLWPEDADRYAAWRGARLPTADEWEKAARGIDGRRWPWGDHWRPGLAVTAELGLTRPMPVRALGAQGEAHLFAAVGGVFEHTSSWWRGRQDRGRVVMGGCYTHEAATARPSLRLSHQLSGNLKTGARL
ncbi:MAG TPA: SUMF1/EgtB/PvdO family nonheme iron enzyme, partial [Myxococcota bacterium]|nr:SUMF1/EgtB/PvdO family nonheme iron enzyme [Myxococcota bacterium]